MQPLDPAQTASASTAAPAAVDDELETLMRRVRTEVDGLRVATWRWSVVALRRTQMGAVELFFVASFYIGLLVALTTLTIVGCVQMVAGARVWLGDVIGPAGAGDFLAGALAVAAAFGVGFVTRSFLRQRVVRSAKRQLSDLERRSSSATSVGGAA